MKNCTFSFCPNFFWSHFTCGGVRKRFWGKNFQGRPKKKKSKKVNKILFPFPFPFPVIPKNGGLWFPFPNFGNGFFHSLPVPEFREWIFFIPFPFPNFGNGFFSFPSRSRILGIDFFIPFPFPNFGNGFFSFPSRSRIEGMGFFNSLPVPELREWNYPFPFPFPNSQMSFPLTPASKCIAGGGGVHLP